MALPPAVKRNRMVAGAGRRRPAASSTARRHLRITLVSYLGLNMCIPGPEHSHGRRLESSRAGPGPPSGARAGPVTTAN